MRRCFTVWFLLAVLVSPFSVHAQSPIRISSFQVELWPEYDQPSMLVINYVMLAPVTPLPATLVFHLPATAGKPSALAVGQTLSTVSDQGVEYSVAPQGSSLDVTIHASGPAIQLEYYDTLQKNGTNHAYQYQWLTDYQIDSFALILQQPPDATNLTASPALPSSETRSDNLTYFSNDFGSLTAGQRFTLSLSYTKASDKLTIAQQNVQPSEPLNANTPGRVMLGTYLPYILGGIGLILIAGGLLYFWRSGRSSPSEARRRHPAKNEKEGGSDIYCHQCGTRARDGDRFCRVCGTKLRSGE